MHTCSQCDSVFSRPYRLALHIKSHENKKTFKCKHEGCDREYTNNSHLIRHCNSTHSSNPKTESFNCSQCWKVFTNRQNLNRHLKVHHAPASPKHVCGSCNMNFLKSHMLVSHMYQHTGVKGFHCQLCSQSFVSLQEKKRHLRFHKTYTCENCNEVFQHWSIFQAHKKQYHKEKEFICDHCNRKFKQRSQILRHLKLHNVANRVVFTCPISRCTKFYSTKYNLNQHIQSAHLKKTHDCTVCNAKLSTKDRLKKHMKTHEKVTIKLTIKRAKAARRDKGIPKTSVALKLAQLNVPKLADLTKQHDNMECDHKMVEEMNMSK